MPSRRGGGEESAGRSSLVMVSFCGKAMCLAVKFAVLALSCEGQNETTAGVSDDPTAPPDSPSFGGRGGGRVPAHPIQLIE